MSGMTNKVLTQDWKDIPEISNMILSRDTTVGLIDQRTSADFEELEVKSMMNSHKSRFHASMFMFS